MQTNKVLPIVFLILAFIGFADATYLTIQHFLGKIPPCAITSSCETVLTSHWSVIYGIPVSLVGALYYLAILLLTVAYFSTGKEKLLTTASFGTCVGFITSLWLVSLQIFIIKNLCFYCMLSAIISTLLLITGILIIRAFRKKSLETNPQSTV